MLRLVKTCNDIFQAIKDFDPFALFEVLDENGIFKAVGLLMNFTKRRKLGKNLSKLAGRLAKAKVAYGDFFVCEALTLLIFQKESKQKNKDNIIDSFKLMNIKEIRDMFEKKVSSEFDKELNYLRSIAAEKQAKELDLYGQMSDAAKWNRDHVKCHKKLIDRILNNQQILLGQLRTIFFKNCNSGNRNRRDTFPEVNETRSASEIKTCEEQLRELWTLNGQVDQSKAQKALAVNHNPGRDLNVDKDYNVDAFPRLDD